MIKGYTDGDATTQEGYTFPLNPRTIVIMPDFSYNQVGLYIPVERNLETGEPVDGDSSSGAFHLETVDNNGVDVTYITIRSTFSGLISDIYMFYSDFIDAVANTFHFHPVWQYQETATYARGENHDQPVSVLARGTADDVREMKTYPMLLTSAPSRDENTYSGIDYWHDPVYSFDEEVVGIDFDVTRADQQAIEAVARQKYKNEYGVDYPYPITDYEHNLCVSPRYLESSHYYMSAKAYEDWCNYTGVVIPVTE